jgi:hypothetical protein
MKTCIECKVSKDEGEFVKATNRCVICYKIKNQKYYQKNKDRLNDKSRKYTADHQDEIKSWRKDYYAANKEERKTEQRERHHKRLLSTTPEDIKRMRLQGAINQKKYRLKKKDDPMFKLNERMRENLRVALKEMGTSKQGRHWEELIGYTASQLREHLEQQFTPEMTWENYGSYWHIDHIRPQSWFTYDSAECESFKNCWSLNNLQPLEASINLSKGNRRQGR